MAVEPVGPPDVEVVKFKSYSLFRIWEAIKDISVSGIVLPIVTAIQTQTVDIVTAIQTQTVDLITVLSAQTNSIVNSIIGQRKGSSAVTSLTSVGTTVVLLLPANANRKGFQVSNLGGTILYIGYDNTITASNYVKALQTSAPNEFYEQMNLCYTGNIYAIRNSGTSNCTITEIQ